MARTEFEYSLEHCLEHYLPVSPQCTIKNCFLAACYPDQEF